MIYRDIPYVYNAVLFEPLVGIVIMKVGNPFCLGAPASVFSYVMPGRCAGHPSQVHRQPQLFELAGDIKGQKMHAANMVKGIVAKELPVQLHHLVYVFAVKGFQEQPVLIGVFGNLPVIGIKKP